MLAKRTMQGMIAKQSIDCRIAKQSIGCTIAKQSMFRVELSYGGCGGRQSFFCQRVSKRCPSGLHSRSPRGIEAPLSLSPIFV